MRLAHRCQVRIQSWHHPDYPAGVVTFLGFECYCHEVGCPFRFQHLDQAVAHEAAAQHTHRMNRALEGLRNVHI